MGRRGSLLWCSILTACWWTPTASCWRAGNMSGVSTPGPGCHDVIGVNHGPLVEFAAGAPIPGRARRQAPI